MQNTSTSDKSKTYNFKNKNIINILNILENQLKLISKYHKKCSKEITKQDSMWTASITINYEG